MIRVYFLSNIMDKTPPRVSARGGCFWMGRPMAAGPGLIGSERLLHNSFFETFAELNAYKAQKISKSIA